MAAIVLDHEQPHQEAGSRHREQQGEPPVAEMERCPGQHPERDERHERDRDLDGAAAVAGFAVARENLRPASARRTPIEDKLRFGRLPD